MSLNTVKKWDEFEDSSYRMIAKAVEDWDLSINSNECRIFQKKWYFSTKRQKDIIFDISIEVWPKNSNKYSLLYLVECKNYKGAVPVEKIEAHDSRISQISEHNTKWVFISKNWYQESALKLWDSLWFMMIDVWISGEHNIILHRKEKSVLDTPDDIILRFLSNLFIKTTKIGGLRRLSAELIEKESLVFLEKINWWLREWNDRVLLEEIINFLENDSGLLIEVKPLWLNDLGCCDINSNKIYINNSVVGTKKYPFVLAHEIWHYLLHKWLKVNNRAWSYFNDPEYNIFTDRFELKNDINWVEWQANYFWSCLLMPRKSLHIHLMIIQEKIWNSWMWELYVDNQVCNKKDYMRIMDYLSNYFDVSKVSLQYRLQKLWYLKFSDDFITNDWLKFSNLF